MSQPEIAKNLLKPLILVVQDRSVSSMMIALKARQKFLLCLRLSANVFTLNEPGVKKTFRRYVYLSLTPSFEGNVSFMGSKVRHKQTRVIVACHSKNFLILACTVLLQSQCVTDIHTTHRQTPVATKN